jgi:hypothetical protein
MNYEHFVSPDVIRLLLVQYYKSFNSYSTCGTLLSILFLQPMHRRLRKSEAVLVCPFSCQPGELLTYFKMNGTLTKKTNEENENQLQEGSIVRWNG